MHQALIPGEQVDDFIILRARAFTNNVQRAMIRDVLQDEDISLIEWRLIFSVARFGTCHLAFITQNSSLDPAHGSRAAAALETKGVITRESDPENRRRKLISLTDKGAELFHRIWPNARDLIRAATGEFGQNDLEEFKRLLDLLNKATKTLDVPEHKGANDAIDA